MEKNIATARKLQDSRGTAGGGDFGASFCSDSRATGASIYYVKCSPTTQLLFLLTTATLTVNATIQDMRESIVYSLGIQTHLV